MKIDVTVTEVALDTIVNTYSEDTLGEVIAQQVVNRLVQEERYPTLAERITRIRDEEIRELVTPMIREAFDTPLRRTNSFGEETGEVTTLRDHIVKEARKVLDGGYSGGYSNQDSLARKLIREEISHAFKAELAAVLKEEKDKVVAAVRAAGAELIAEAVTKGIGGR